MAVIKNIGLGTAAIGRPLYINVKQQAEQAPFSLEQFKEDGLQVLNDAYDNGVRYFDTSPGYGLAEALVIDWLRSKNDPEIKVSTKWGYTYVADFDPNATEHEVKEHSLSKLNEQWEVSKQLLPNLNLYQIHSATLDTGVLENKEVLARLHEIKKVHGITIGLTTTGANQSEVLGKALSVEVENEALFQSFQCTFNILDQSIYEYSEALNALSGPLIIKEALANGRLIPNQKFTEYSQLYFAQTKFSQLYEVGADAVALRYCMDKFPNAIVLSGANNHEHLIANLKADEFSFRQADLSQLDSHGIAPETYWQERKELQWN